ncbi:Endonuclease/exonuclease/phosphatase family protein [Orpheovirus IHUMI-LCC2]|uniref:Endonuclease/exonuclease/phosphatase family protein n=1 Tax=Orpheovirus IHUMI-LCC2 TaxID=2023057 RepID=A0A2I2L3V8_9VIRU|nr:Endonuclease/exonuclease/phosphatase family protein [Orpheovirus IHUMI-LCC2]SNW62214.1 Endonuclease/exonuclease/phosphatase family protein [Orpheovirus IHUMI-LCC2]
MDLTFVSYNIQLSGLDSENHKWDNRKKYIIQLLKSCHIFCLQEVSHSQYIDISNELIEYDIIAYNTITGHPLSMYSIDTEEGLVIGYRKDKFIIGKDFGLRWYGDIPLQINRIYYGVQLQFYKCLQYILLKTKDNKNIYILNSHFTHEDISNNLNPRLLSAEYELSIIKIFNENDIWISSGDRNFHTPRDDNVYNLYLNKGIVDPRKLCPNYGSTSTFIGYEDHVRMNKILDCGKLEKNYYLDVIYNSNNIIANSWTSHLCEYEDGILIPCSEYVKNKNSRNFGSDHT